MSEYLATGGTAPAIVSIVPHLDRQILQMLIRRGVADSGSRNRNAQVI
jgi:hypothetical protein